MSYQLSGYKWGPNAYGTIGDTIYWNASITSGLGYDTNLYSQSQFDTALAGAFQAWEDISQLDFEYTASAAASDIDIWMEFLAGPTIGAATISFFPDTPFGQIVSGEIRLDSSEQWAPVGETDLNFYAVALHEIGHVIGLEHVPDASEIMNASVSVSALDLGDGDILGTRVLYGGAPRFIDILRAYYA